MKKIKSCIICGRETFPICQVFYQDKKVWMCPKHNDYLSGYGTPYPTEKQLLESKLAFNETILEILERDLGNSLNSSSWLEQLKERDQETKDSITTMKARLKELN